MLLLDEPLSALDEFLRLRMRGELKSLQNELGITFVHVTHTQPEAIALADMVVVMDTGRIDQADTANVIFDKPKTPYVARFMGGQNVLTGTVEAGSSGTIRLKSAAGAVFEAKAGATATASGSQMSVSVRRDRIALRRRRDDASSEVNSIPGVVVTTEYQGSYVKVTLDVGGGIFVANISDGAYFAEPVTMGDAVIASWKTEDVHVLTKVDTGLAGDPYLDAGALEKRKKRNRSKIRAGRGRQKKADAELAIQKAGTRTAERPCAKAKYLLFGSLQAKGLLGAGKRDLA